MADDKKADPVLSVRDKLELNYEKFLEGQSGADEPTTPEPEKKVEDEGKPDEEQQAAPEGDGGEGEGKSSEDAPQDPPAPEAPEAKLKALEEENAKLKEAMQKRIDEITAEKRRIEEEAKKSKEVDGGTKKGDIKNLSTQALREALKMARSRHYGESENGAGDGSEDLNIQVEENVIAELVRRRREAEDGPAREAQTLQMAQNESQMNAYRTYQKELLVKDEKTGNWKINETSDVVKKSRELYAEAAKDPVLSRHPDLPMILVEKAIAMVGKTTDEKLRIENHKLKKEVERLRAQGLMDGGRGADGAPAPKDVKEESEADILAERKTAIRKLMTPKTRKA